MDDNEDTTYAESAQHMDELLGQHNNPVIIFNQHDQAIEYVDQLTHINGQHSIEVFQDTQGVFGLRAYCQTGKIQTPETLELFD